MRKLMIILVALGLLAAAPAPTPAQAAPTWYDGSISYSSILNCVSIIQGAPYVEYGVGAYTGFRGDSSAASPAPGEIYWIHIVVYGLGNACAGQYVSPEFILPVNTTTAIDASHKIQCYATGTADPGDCPSSLASGSHGGLVVLSPDTAHARMWPLPQGKNWEWQIPVVSDRPLTSSIFGGYLTVADGNTSPTLALTQNAYVFAKNPQVTYPAPSTTSITSTGAVSKANLYSGGLAGTGYFDIGTTAGYGLFSDPIAIPAGGPSWQPYTDWKRANGTSVLQAGKTYHWRFRYVAGGTTYYGADQTFTTTGSGSTTPPTTPPTPGAPTARIAAVPRWVTSTTQKVSWGGTAGTSAIASYDVRVRRAAWNGAYGSYSTWKAATTATSATIAVAPGSSYCFSSRARATNGAISAWTADTCLNTPIDDRKLSVKGTWKKSTASAAFARTLRSTTKAKASLSARNAKVRRLALLVTKVRGGGSVTVKVGSRVLGTYKLAASKTRYRMLIALPALSSSRTSTITITSTSKKKVIIDALLVAR